MCVNKNTSIPDFPFYDFISFTFFMVYNGGIHMFEITVSYTMAKMLFSISKYF